MLHRPLTVLFGQSGLGKTSLLRAGLMPRLREAGYEPILIRLVHDNEAGPLEGQVVAEIRRHYDQISGGHNSDPIPTVGLWQFFHDPDFGFVAGGARSAGGDRQSRRPVLILDQFEEIFTQGEAKRPADARAFIEALACLVENRPPTSVRRALEQDDELADRLQLAPQPCKVLMTLREDFLHRLERWRRQMPSMMDNRCELRLLSGAQAYRAVYEPGTIRTRARSNSANGPSVPIVAPNTARGIVRFVAGVESDVPLEEIDNVPPLLSLICEQLNARRSERGLETIESEALEQSAPDVLREFYENSFSAYPAAVREFVEAKLISESGFRESVTLDTAIAELRRSNLPDPESALRGLVDQRLLVIDERGGISRVEFTHDILAPIAAASRAERLERHALEEAKRLLAEQRRKARRRAVLTGVMTLLTITASCGALYGWRMAVRANTNAARANQATHHGQRLLYAARMNLAQAAWESARVGRVLELLEETRRDQPELTGFEWHYWNRLTKSYLVDLKGHTSFVTSVAFSPDGKRLASASGDQTVKVWDAQKRDER